MGSVYLGKPGRVCYPRYVKTGKDYKELLKEAAKKNPKLYKEYLTQSEYEEEIAL